MSFGVCHGTGTTSSCIRSITLLPGKGLGTYCLRQISACQFRYVGTEHLFRGRRWNGSQCTGDVVEDVSDGHLEITATIKDRPGGSVPCFKDGLHSLWILVEARSVFPSLPMGQQRIFSTKCDLVPGIGGQVSFCNMVRCRGQSKVLQNNLDTFCFDNNCDNYCSFCRAGAAGGGSVRVTMCPRASADCRRCGQDCEHCDDCEEFPCEGKTCCTPSVVRATTSSVTNPGVGTCITATTESYKVAGSTAINRTLDLGQVLGTPCKFRGAVSSNYVLRRATKFAIDTLTYRAEIVSSTQWRMRVIGSGSGHSQTVEFFDGTATISAGLCNASATANNSFTSCSLTASPKRGGHSGTFAKPVTVTSGTSCSHCSSLTTPSSFSATIASVTVCTMQCDGSRWRLTGTTAINRSITLSQVGGSPCVFEATVSADYLLFDHDTAAETWSNLLLIYELERTSSGNGTWEIYGEDSSGNKRVSFAGANSGGGAVNPMTVSGFSANNCKDWPTASHPTRSASADQTNHTVIVGSAGSTVFSACPDE
jgi:hypothetical protein